MYENFNNLFEEDILPPWFGKKVIKVFNDDHSITASAYLNTFKFWRKAWSSEFTKENMLVSSSGKDGIRFTVMIGDSALKVFVSSKDLVLANLSHLDSGIHIEACYPMSNTATWVKESIIPMMKKWNEIPVKQKPPLAIEEKKPVNIRSLFNDNGTDDVRSEGEV